MIVIVFILVCIVIVIITKIFQSMAIFNTISSENPIERKLAVYKNLHGGKIKLSNFSLKNGALRKWII